MHGRGHKCMLGSEMCVGGHKCVVEVKNPWWKSMGGWKHVVEVGNTWLVVVAAQNMWLEVENTWWEGQKWVVEVRNWNMWWVAVEGSKHVVEGLWVGWVGLCWPLLACIGIH